VRAEVTGLVTLIVGDLVRTRSLPRQSAVTLGRGRLNEIDIQQPWVPRELVTFEPSYGGWIAVNGYRARVSVSGLWVDGQVRFEPRARPLM
jgi:hypothetical protein